MSNGRPRLLLLLILVAGATVPVPARASGGEVLRAALPPGINMENRLCVRLTAEGQVRNCLFSRTEWDARALLRGGGSDDQLAELVRDCVWAKAPAHGIGSDNFTRPDRAMHQIGG